DGTTTGGGYGLIRCEACGTLRAWHGPSAEEGSTDEVELDDCCDPRRIAARRCRLPGVRGVRRRALHRCDVDRERAGVAPGQLWLHARRRDAREVQQLREEDAEAPCAHGPPAGQAMPHARPAVRACVDLWAARCCRVLRDEEERQREGVDRRLAGRVQERPSVWRVAGPLQPC